MLASTELSMRFADLSDDQAHAIVREGKRVLGSRLVVLGHHYQRDEVIAHADFTGDSLRLARIAKEQTAAEYIIFCGVHFMAEAADMLTGGKAQVCLPDLGAGCDMADMADIRDVELAWQDAIALGIKESEIIPVTYINSTAALKAFVGKHNGAICTSGNASKVIEWGLSQGKYLFFFPDQHLGRNISKSMGFDPAKDMLLWDPKKPRGGLEPNVILDRRIWLWKGHCPVHALFSVHQIKKIRQADAKTTVIVHPECAMDVVDLSDMSGSTDFIIKTIAAAPAGSSWAVGTEKHLVERLAKIHPDKTIVSLNPFTCLCGTMNRISLRHLAWVMTEIMEGRPMPNRIQVDPVTAKNGLTALDRMLELV